MALRAVPDHPKFAELKAILHQPKGPTAGWLEMLWHFTGRFTPQGNIGKYSDQAIEAWVEWNGEPGKLIEALVQSRWIDRDPVHRLLVHDWHEHADKATKNALARAKLTLCTPTVRTASVQSTNEKPELSTASRLPEPEPVPEPVAISEAKASSPRPSAGEGASDSPEELIYQAYPRKEGRGSALKAIAKAVERIRVGEGAIPPIPDRREARAYLFQRTQTYARSPAGSREDRSKIPHPTTWYGESRYLDDESNWQFNGENRGKTNGNIAAARAALEHMARRDVERVGGSPASIDQPTNVRALLVGTR